MYPDLPDGYALVRHHMLTGAGDGHAFIIYGCAPNAAGLTDPDDVAARAQGNFGLDIVPHLSDALEADYCEITWNDGGTLKQGVSTTPYTGGSATASYPPQVAALARKNTGLLGRHYRGRVYIPGIPLGVITAAGVLSSLFLADLQTGLNDWMNDMTTTSAGKIGGMWLLHRSTLVAPTGVNTLTLEAQIATQRRRNRKAPHR